MPTPSKQSIEPRYPVIGLEKSFFYVCKEPDLMRQVGYKSWKKTKFKGEKIVDSDQRLFIVKDSTFDKFYGPLWGYNLVYTRLALVNFEYKPNPQIYPLDELKMQIAKTLKVERRSIVDPSITDKRMEDLRAMTDVGQIMEYFYPFYRKSSEDGSPWKIF